MTARGFPIRAHFGAPGSGKTYEIKRRLAELKAPRLFVFDARGEYLDLGAATSKLAAVAERSAGAAYSIVFRPSDDLELARRQFSVFCSIAFERGHCVLAVDELADVTSPAKAPAGWTRVVRQGRHRFMQVFAAAQRPTEIDNRLFSLATVIRTGRLNAQGDRDKLAGVLDLDPAEIAGLGARGWIERDMLTGRVTRG